MPRFATLARTLLPLALLAGLATGCGNKGPLFLPPPAVQKPEGAAPPAAPPPASEDAGSGAAGPQGPADGN